MLEQLEPRQLLSTYYVSPTGSDSASGTAITAAWKTINRVNNQTLQAGDKVLFEGGKTFSGSLYLTSNECGTAPTGVTFSTYGSGRATINCGAKTGSTSLRPAASASATCNSSATACTTTPSFGIYVHVDSAARRLRRRHQATCEVPATAAKASASSPAARARRSTTSPSSTDSHDNRWGGVKANTCASPG